LAFEIEQKEKLEAVSWQLLKWNNHCLALARSLFPSADVNPTHGVGDLRKHLHSTGK